MKFGAHLHSGLLFQASLKARVLGVGVGEWNIPS